MRRAIRAVVFDFDGLVIDTEATLFRAWQEFYAAHGQVLPIERWLDCIGTTPEAATDWFDPHDELERLVGHPLDRAEVDEATDSRNRELIEAEEVRPGVHDWLDEAEALGLALAVASSSDRAWLEDHLGRLGLLPRFAHVASRDDVEVAKPRPDVYLAALAAIGADPVDAVAVEDSPNGVLAAKAAGMFCVAVPSTLTRRMRIEGADLELASLAERSVRDVIELAERVPAS